MPSFTCVACGKSFDLPQGVIDKYPGWQPKHCRAHRKGVRKARGRGRRGASSPVEERLSPDEVLAKYTEGPKDGVFTDGSSIPNPGPGGWGAVWVRDGEIVEQRHGHDAHTTNNRMELTALIEALKLLPEDSTEVVHTDSRLCVDTIEKWAAGWEKRGWKRKAGPIKNLELIQELYALRQARPGVTLRWIAAHSGQRWNEYADSLSTLWCREGDADS